MSCPHQCQSLTTDYDGARMCAGAQRRVASRFLCCDSANILEHCKRIYVTAGRAGHGMVSSALSANRALAALDWVVGHTGESFTLSELSRALGINVPSLMSVLKSLTDAGYLIRHPEDKSFEPGPALLAVGLVTSAQHRAFELLPGELKQLSETVEIECFASVAVSDQTVVVAEAGRPSSYSPAIRVGFRYPLMAPIGHAFMAWNSPAEIEDWIKRADYGENKLDRSRLNEELQIVRSQGYAVIRYNAVDFRPSSALETLAERPRDPKRYNAVKAAVAEFSKNLKFLEPKPGRPYESLNISAPVFSHQGKVLMNVVINGVPRVDGREVLAHCERLLQMTRLLTKASGGQTPKESRRTR
jgi:DNA-binding IclR family transcriptional regulator